jgi:hypothetical protein
MSALGYFSSARQQVIYALEHGVYQGLELDQKLELCKLLLSLTKEGDNAVSVVTNQEPTPLTFL